MSDLLTGPLSGNAQDGSGSIREVADRPRAEVAKRAAKRTVNAAVDLFC
jgi:hypothetical protein